MKIVYFVVNKYFSNCTIMERDDLIQEGSIGLIKAVDEWDESKGVKFITYATNNIRWAIMNVLRSQSVFKISTGINEIIVMIRKRNLQDAPAAEIAKIIGRTESSVSLALDYMKTSLVSTSRKAKEDEDELQDILPEFIVEDDKDTNLLKEQILSYVSDSYRQVLKMSFEGYSTEQIANHLGITLQQASSKITHGRRDARKYRHLIQEVM